MYVVCLGAIFQSKQKLLRGSKTCNIIPPKGFRGKNISKNFRNKFNYILHIHTYSKKNIFKKILTQNCIASVVAGRRQFRKTHILCKIGLRTQQLFSLAIRVGT